ncbi:MAG: VanZ family protein [Flavobacteriaceae bacterium]|jgi:hypothetical protein|nr:VanZ family protein [Flavobacteriaceae bacterium]
MLKNIKNWLDNHPRIIKIVFGFYFIILTGLLLKSPEDNQSLKLLGSVLGLGTGFGDKIVHIITFLGLSLLGRTSFPKRNPVILILLFTLYGVAIEFLQEYMSTGRTCEFLDMLADFTGCLLGVILAKLLIKKTKSSG